ncbi:PspC domain-containing protein [Leifsonia sp. H3M29-4]|uniref:PspC domain-containing protein n=1 Tax=Salinibacterium metalliresistens TaxID=3031321 RepID=UPI0023D9BF5E|nr:PspC domain-containing protein [Salinibacterium metalliresistens]MDF1480060.1 PspC domain-containing protein [Salinibacterium metalliresistens]
MSILVRPRTGRVLGGVCLAIANRFDWDVTLVRVVTAAAVVFTGVGLVLYIAFWIAIPSEV